MKFKNDAGRSMMEMILYIGIIIMLGVTTMKTYGDSVEKTRIIEAENQISEIAEKVNNYYMGRPFPITGQIETTLKTKLGNQIKLIDPWGSNITIYANKSGIANHEVLPKPYFGITYKNLDTARCVNIANTFAKQSPAAISINTNSVVSTANKAIPDITTIADNCKNTGIGNYVTGWFIKD